MTTITLNDIRYAEAYQYATAHNKSVEQLVEEYIQSLSLANKAPLVKHSVPVATKTLQKMFAKFHSSSPEKKLSEQSNKLSEQSLLQNLPESWQKLYGVSAHRRYDYEDYDARFKYLMEKYK